MSQSVRPDSLHFSSAGDVFIRRAFCILGTDRFFIPTPGSASDAFPAPAKLAQHFSTILSSK